MTWIGRVIFIGKGRTIWFAFWHNKWPKRPLNFLYAHGEEVVLGHSVVRLCREAAQHEPSLQERCAHWAVLDTYYIPTRYPNGLPDDIPARVYDETTAQSALRLAEEVVTAIKTFFSEAE